MLLSQDKLLADQEKIIKDTISDRDKNYNTDRKVYITLIKKMKDQISHLESSLQALTLSSKVPPWSHTYRKNFQNRPKNSKE